MKRHNFSLRTPTTMCQKPPSEYEKVLVDFVIYLAQLRSKENYSYFYAADETAVWLDISGSKCVAEKGEKEVSFF
jgi:hypothetical protein